MATHSSTLAWRNPGMAEHDGLPSMGFHSQTGLKQLSMVAQTMKRLSSMQETRV